MNTTPTGRKALLPMTWAVQELTGRRYKTAKTANRYLRDRALARGCWAPYVGLAALKKLGVVY